MSITTITQRDRLADVRGRTKELRNRLQRAREFQQVARQAAENYSGEDLAHSEEFMRLERAAGDVDQIASNLELVEAEERFVLSQMAGVEGPMVRDSFLQDPGVLEELRQLATSSAPVGSLNLGQVISAEDWAARYCGRLANLDFRNETFAADPTLPESAPSRLGTYQGVVPQLRRRLTLLDLLTTGTMSGNSFVFTQEAGNLDTAAETAELAAKVDADTVLTDLTVYARTIAHYTKLARQQLSDVPQLGTTINTRLIYGVNRRLETQVLNGDGTGENLLGILHTAGIGAPASGGGDSVNADLILNGIGTVLDSSAVPTAVVMHPDNWNRMLKVKATGSGQRLDSDGAFAVQGDTIWGLPVVLNLGIPAGTAIVGDFAFGGTLFVREGVSVRTSDADQDDFTRNRITMLGEGRFAWACWQPTAFAKVTLSFSS